MSQLLLQNDLIAGVPYVAQYLGAWAMTEQGLNALKTEAEQVNVQLHLDAQSQAMPIAAASDEFLSVNNDGVAIIQLHGSLMKHRASFSSNTSTVEARRQVRAARTAESVKAVLLHIDSPGGTVAGTDDLARDIQALAADKPTTAYIEDLGASAAYWLAAQANEIYSNAQAVVGSIGVLSVVYDLSKAAEDAGIKVHLIKAGEFKGAGVAGAEVTAEQLAEWQRIVDAFYDDFVSAVEKGRGITRAEARSLADARVHVGPAAAQLGLTDGVRSLDDVLEDLAAKGAAANNSGGSIMTTTTEPVGATLAELKAALPDADPAFILEQLEAGVTVDEAQKSHAALEIAKLKADLAERDEREAKLKADLEKSQKANEKPVRSTQQALADDSGDEPAPTFMGLVKQMMEETGQDRRACSLAIAKAHPDLHEAFLDQAPPARSQDGLK